MTKIIEFRKISESEKYTKAVAKQIGLEISNPQMEGIKLYDETLEHLIEILRKDGSKLQFQNAIAVLGKLMAQLCVSAEVAAVDINIDTVLKYISNRYDEALQQWLDDDHDLGDYL